MPFTLPRTVKPCAQLAVRYFNAMKSLGEIDSLMSVSCFRILGATLRFSKLITLF